MENRQHGEERCVEQSVCTCRTRERSSGQSAARNQAQTLRFLACAGRGADLLCWCQRLAEVGRRQLPLRLRGRRCLSRSWAEHVSLPHRCKQIALTWNIKPSEPHVKDYDQASTAVRALASEPWPSWPRRSLGPKLQREKTVYRVPVYATVWPSI